MPTLPSLYTLPLLICQARALKPTGQWGVLVTCRQPGIRSNYGLVLEISMDPTPWTFLSPYLATVTGIPIIGQRIAAAKATTSIRTTLAGIPAKRNSPGVNCFES